MLRKFFHPAPCALNDAGCEFPLKRLIVEVLSLNFFATAAGEGTTITCSVGIFIYEEHSFRMTGTVQPQYLCSVLTYQPRDTQRLMTISAAWIFRDDINSSMIG